VNEDQYTKFDGLSSVELASMMSVLAEEISSLNDKKRVLQADYDAIRKHALPDAMDAEGISNMSVVGIGRINLRSDLYATIPAANKPAAFDWLRGTGHGGVVKEEVHTGTLKALLKSLIREGKELPPEDLIRVTPYSMAVLTRSNSAD